MSQLGAAGGDAATNQNRESEPLRWPVIDENFWFCG